MNPDLRDTLAHEGVDSADVAAICDGNVAWLFDDVVGDLAVGGYPACLAELHLLASLVRRVEQRVPEAVRHARREWFTWDDIGRVLGVSGSTARGRYRRHDTATQGAPIDP
jgi:hypothetical protein